MRLEKQLKCLSAAAVASLIFGLPTAWHGRVTAAGHTADAQKKVTFNGTFKVTMKGSGVQEAERAGATRVTWRVNRTYSGVFQLTGPQPVYGVPSYNRQEILNRGPLIKTKEKYSSVVNRATPWTVKVDI